MNEIFNEQFWTAAPVLVSLTTTLAGLINQYLDIKSIYKQLISWAVGAALSTGCILCGFIGEASWKSYIAMAVVVALSSNGLYDITTIKTWIGTWFPSKKRTTKNV